MKTTPPITPPMTGAGDNFGFDEIPAAADDSCACAEVVVAAVEVELLDDTADCNPSLDIPVDVGVADTSLCATGIEVLDDIVGVVPCEDEAGVDISLALEADVGVLAVVAGAAAAGGVEEVGVVESGVEAIEDVRTTIVDMAESATWGELP